MSFTIVEDGDTLQVRASLKHPFEIKDLIDALQRRLDDPKNQTAAEGSTITETQRS